MEYKSPDQQLYDSVFAICIGLFGEDKVFDYLPMPEQKAPYPFVYIGESQESDKATKDIIIGQIAQTIHVYGVQEERSTVTGMVGKILTKLRKLKVTDNFKVSIMDSKTVKKTIQDTSTSIPLWHGILDVQFKFN